MECYPVYSLLSYSKGFICSSGSGTVHLFEKTEERNNFKKIRSVAIWTDPVNESHSWVDSEVTGLDILSMTLNASEENVICSTRSQQLYTLTLSAADLGKVSSFVSC